MENLKRLAQAEHCIVIEDKIKNLREIMETLTVEWCQENYNLLYNTLHNDDGTYNSDDLNETFIEECFKSSLFVNFVSASGKIKEEYNEIMINYCLQIIGYPPSAGVVEYMYMEDFIEYCENEDDHEDLMLVTDNIIREFCKYYGILETIDAAEINKKTLMLETIEDMMNGPTLK